MKKLTSRKFITAIAGIIAGIVMIFGVDRDVVSTVSGAAISLASLVAYIVTEGRIDAAGISVKGAEDKTDGNDG